MNKLGASVKNLFVHKEGEPWPPKWMLIFCLLCALTGTGWNGYVAYRSEQRAVQEQTQKEQLLGAAQDACDSKAPITTDGTELCREVQDAGGEAPPKTPDSIKFTDSATGFTYICYAQPKGSADYTCTQLLP